MSTELLDQAIIAIKSGDKKTGGKLLLQVIRMEPQGKDAETAWLWMSQVVEDPKRRIQCLETVLTINPNNKAAQKGLTALAQSYKHEIRADTVASSKPQTLSSPPVPPENVVPSPSILSKSDGTKERMAISLTAIELPQLLGMLGGVVLLLGAFVPIVRLPIVGQISFFHTGQGYGVILILLTVTAMVLTILRHYKLVWIPALITSGILAGHLFNFLRIIAEMDSVTQGISDESGLFGGLVTLLFESVQLEWGWVILFLGAALVLLVPVSHPPSRLAVGPIGLGVGITMLIMALQLISNRSINGVDQVSSDSNAVISTNSEPLSQGIIPANQPIEYQGNVLRVVQVHDPVSFLVTDRISLSHKPAVPVPGTRFIAIEFEFTCSTTDATVCETVPEASLELMLVDGRRVDDEWHIYDMPELGEKDVASGNTVTGWRAFRMPDNGEIAQLVINPFGAPSLYAALPTSVNGYQVTQPWQELEPGTQVQLVTGLRRALLEAGISSGSILHIDTEPSFLHVEICEDIKYSFDDDEILQNHRESILDTLLISFDYLLSNENLALSFNECTSVPVFEFDVLFVSSDLQRWKSEGYRANQVLEAAFVNRD